MTINWPAVQTMLAVKADGKPGPITYSALLAKVGGKTPIDGLGAAMAKHAAEYQIDANANRMAGFLGECAHESLGFTLMHELWGPTPQQRTYDGRMGNIRPGDGYLYRGRGLIEITGFNNYGAAGADLGIDLIAHPELAAEPDAAVLVSLWFWRKNALNALCDQRDWTTLTKRINGGLTGQAERLQYITRALEVLS